jgi:phage-related protein
MSVTGIASSILSTLSGLQNQRSPIQQIKSEFKQLGQDLQSGNLSQAQSDFGTLTQNLSSAFQGAGGANPISQEFTQLG